MAVWKAAWAALHSTRKYLGLLWVPSRCCTKHASTILARRAEAQPPGPCLRELGATARLDLYRDS
jgi:hypothetical protein